MLIIAVWMVPYAGALVAMSEKLPLPETDISSEPPLKGVIHDMVPEELQVEGLPLFRLDDNIQSVNGFPLFKWEALSTWASAADDEATRMRAIEAGKRAWLIHLRDHFEPRFRLYESKHAYILSPLANGVLAAAADYVAVTKKRIQHVLEGIVEFRDERKTVLLIIDKEAPYYDYIGCYHPETGEFLSDKGVYLDSGCGHIVIMRADLATMEPVITREMTRSAIAHLDLPAWLTEGLAINTQCGIHGASFLADPQATMHAQRTYWQEEEIQEFWSGKVFERLDGVSALARELARVVVEQMAGNREPFRAFVLNARQADAGRQAAVEEMGIDLGGYICALLEKQPTPDWSPDPSLWEEPVFDVV